MINELIQGVCIPCGISIIDQYKIFIFVFAVVVIIIFFKILLDFWGLNDSQL